MLASISSKLIDDFDGLIKRRFVWITNEINSKIGKARHVGAVFLNE